MGIAASATVLAPVAEADTGLISVTTVSPLKAQRHIPVEATCVTPCSLTATLYLQLKGPDLGPTTVGPGTFVPGTVAVPYIDINKPALQALRHDIGKARLKVSFDATDTTTGAADHVERVFRFKK